MTPDELWDKEAQEKMHVKECLQKQLSFASPCNKSLEPHSKPKWDADSPLHTEVLEKIIFR